MNTPSTDTRTGRFNYLNRSTQPSLFRNGKVYTKRDADGSDSGVVGVERDARDVTVYNARTLPAAERKSLATHGFDLLDAPLDDDALDFMDHSAVLEHYYPQCEALVAGATGARAWAFDHNIRSAVGKKSRARIRDGQQVQGPAKIVHGDYTLHSAPARLQDLARPPALNDTIASRLAPGATLLDATAVAGALRDGRFAIINVWRSIADEPVYTDPLALCDSQTVAPEDLVVFEIHYADRIGENYFARPSDRHRFYFYPQMVRSEAMLIKQWDSAGPMARSNGERADASDPEQPSTFSFHSAFDDVTVPDDAPDRHSIEVRCMVIYE
ncbi:MAG: CmcJ/NvfI family oxidoreductase [Pseudomonadota bacterium]